MAETPNPQGVFDHLKGATSKDTEAASIEAAEAEVLAEAKKVEVKKAEPGPAKPVEGESDADAERLRQHVARLERQLKNMGPYAQFGLALAQDQQGKQLADRWARGEALWEGEESPPIESGMTREMLHQELDAREASKRQIDELMEVAEENLPGFKKLRKSPKFLKALNGAMVTVLNDPTWYEDAPKEVQGWENELAAKNYTAITQAYRYMLANSPKVIEAAKAAGKKEASERAEAAMAASVSGSGTSSSSGEPPKKSEADDLIERMINAKGVGKPFRNFGRGS